MSYDNLFFGDTDTPNHTQWKIKTESLLEDRNIFNPTAGKYFPLGALTESRDGRLWRYQQNGGVELSPTLCQQSAVGTAGWQNQAQTNGVANAINSKRVTLVMATTVTKDQLIDSYLTIEDLAGEGHMYLISGNTAGTANSTSGYDTIVDIADTGGLRVALTTASEITITLNKYKSVVVFPTDPTGVATGIAHVTVPISYYFWGQVRGPAAVLNGATDTIVVGDACGVGGTTAGAACLLDVAAEGDTLLGYVMRPAGDGETCLIDLKLE